jgi:branched-chain amino acid transport system substrate-binding protein
MPAAGFIINSAYNLGYRETAFLGTDSWDGILSYIQYPEARQSVYYSSSFSSDDNDPAVNEFIKDYFMNFSQMPLTSAATAHTVVHILAEAIENAGNTNSADIVAAMRAGEFDTVTGMITFDENNNPRTYVYVIEIKHGIYSMREKLSIN